MLIYADLDGLKYVNDHFGHKHGDGSIVAFARRVRSAIRKDDLFARMGGDEFVILMNVRDEDAGVLVADRLNRVLNVEVLDDDTGLLSSMGVLILPPGLRSIDVELKAADTLMYEAKRTRIGMLMGTGEVVDREVVLSRHIAHVAPPEQRSAIRSRNREPDAANGPTIRQNVDEPAEVAKTIEPIENPGESRSFVDVTPNTMTGSVL